MIITRTPLVTNETVESVEGVSLRTQFGNTVGASFSSSLATAAAPAKPQKSLNTLAEKLTPDVNYSAPVINPANIQATRSLKGNEENYNRIGNTRADINETRAKLDINMGQARTALINEVGKVAEKRGIDPNTAMHSVMPRDPSDMTSALVSVVLEAKGGAVLNAFEMAFGYAEDRKKLSAGVIESLVAEARHNLAHEARKAEVQMQDGAKPAGNAPQFQNLTQGDAYDLLAGKWNQQKEMLALDAAEHALDEHEEENELADAKTQRKIDGLALSANEAFFNSESLKDIKGADLPPEALSELRKSFPTLEKQMELARAPVFTFMAA